MSTVQSPASIVADARATDWPDFAKRYVNLASEDFGAQVLSCSDEFFAPAQRCLQSSSPVFIAGKFDDNGKWMDGWETQRRRRGGHDFAIIRLAFPGQLKGLDIDTSHFTGNFPPAASVHACQSTSSPDESTRWTEIVAATTLSGDAHHFIRLPDDDRVWTHLRLSIYPDGGVARFRVYGQPVQDWSSLDPEGLYEVSALHMGGRIVSYNNAHYGTPFRLLMPGRGVNMGDGWETRRRREPGHDWCVIQLGHPALIQKIEVDTAHFRGNYPERVSVHAGSCKALTDDVVTTQAMFWPELLSEQTTRMHKQHFYDLDVIKQIGPVTHVRVNMFPDGGISRVRIWGRLDGASWKGTP